MIVVGVIVGRNITTEFRPPCRTNKIAREIPAVMTWYRYPAVQLIMAGFLPFSAIYIELHYIFAAIWGHKIYTLFGILYLAFIMLAIVTSFITIALLYFQLTREDHRWWWRSIFNGGSTGLFGELLETIQTRPSGKGRRNGAELSSAATALQPGHARLLEILKQDLAIVRKGDCADPVMS